MSFDDHKAFWVEFMMLYQDQACLWDIKNKDYRSKHKRNGAYNILLEKCKEVFPDATKEFVTKKISSFRASFRRQVRRLNAAKKNCEKAEHMPETTLWYFDLLFFLLDQEESRPAASPVETNGFDETESSQTGFDYSLIETKTRSPKISEAALSNSIKRTLSPSSTTWDSKRQLLDASLKALQDDEESEGPVGLQNSIHETQELTFGRNVGQQLQDIELRQKIIAQKLISDVLYHAKLGNLTDTSLISVGLLVDIPKLEGTNMY